MPSTARPLFVGWTTVDSAAQARRLAAGLVGARLAACVQVDGPVVSHYIWEGRRERATEWRLWVKFPADRAAAVQAWLRAHHPYAIPQWLAVEAALAAPAYRAWVWANTRAAPPSGKNPPRAAVHKKRSDRAAVL